MDNVYFWQHFYATGYTFGVLFMRQSTGCGETCHTPVTSLVKYPLPLCLSHITVSHMQHLSLHLQEKYGVDMIDNKIQDKAAGVSYFPHHHSSFSAKSLIKISHQRKMTS